MKTGVGGYLRKRDNKWISAGKLGVEGLPKKKRKQTDLKHVKTEVGVYLRKRENKWISTGKNRGWETNLRKRENKWISTGKNRGRGGGGGLT